MTFHFLPIRADPTPFHDDPPGADAFYRALGLVLLAWGRFEGHFVGDLQTLMVLSWDSLPKHELPRAWKKRADFWKKAFKTLPVLAPVQDQALTLIPDIVAGSRDRGILAHAIWGGFVSADPLAIDLMMLKSDGEHIEAGNMPVTVAKLEQALALVNSLNLRLLPISIFLNSLRVPPPGARTLWRPLGSPKTPLR